jgi:hypothetical protein
MRWYKHLNLSVWDSGTLEVRLDRQIYHSDERILNRLGTGSQGRAEGSVTLLSVTGGFRQRSARI